MQLGAVWKELLSEVEPHINRQSFETWLKPTELISINGKEAYISVPNRFFGDWIKEHYYPLLLNTLETKIGEEDLRIHFVVQDKGELPSPPEREKKKGNLNGRYTFDSFVVGSSNQFAHAASRRVAEQPGSSYNPLFIYGGVGLGKTHLLSAIGNFIFSKGLLLRIVYLSAEQFTNDVINSIRYQKMDEFRNKYRNVDTLLIDDIQFISGKERTQEEFFHTFNTLYEANKQVVITSDRSAKELSDIEGRLRSRFEMGLTADIQPPDLETKIVILRRKAEAENITFPNDVALFLAAHIKTNIRELEGALIRLGAFSSLTGQEITLEMAKRVLRDTIQEKKKTVTIEDIQRAVSERFQIKILELKSKKRTKNCVYPRQISMYLCRELTNLSFPEIGKHFGGKDHSTVIHACKQIEQGKEEDFNLKTTLESLIQNLQEE